MKKNRPRNNPLVKKCKMKLMLDLQDARPTPNRGAYRPRPIGVREGQRTTLVYLPRKFGLAKDWSGKAGEKPSSRIRFRFRHRISKSPPHGRCRSSWRDFSPCRDPPSPRGHVWDTKIHIKSEKQRSRLRTFCFPPHSPDFYTLVPEYMSDSPSIARTLPHPIARLPSILVSSMCLHGNPGPHSLMLSMRMGLTMTMAK
jgi:hypothetical protein